MTEDSGWTCCDQALFNPLGDVELSGEKWHGQAPPLTPRSVHSHPRGVHRSVVVLGDGDSNQLKLRRKIICSLNGKVQEETASVGPWAQRCC